MLSFVFLFIVLAALVVLGTWLFGRVVGRGEAEPPADPEAVAAANRAAVARGDLDSVRFEVVARGYDPGQVEAVLDQVTALSAPVSRAGEEAQPGPAR